MRVIARRRLREFWTRHPDSEQPLLAWFREAKHADWRRPADITADNRNASILPGDRVVFNIKGNEYRLVVALRYDRRAIYVRFVGTHTEYDRIDAETI